MWNFHVAVGFWAQFFKHFWAQNSNSSVTHSWFPQWIMTITKKDISIYWVVWHIITSEVIIYQESHTQCHPLLSTEFHLYPYRLIVSFCWPGLLRGFAQAARIEQGQWVLFGVFAPIKWRTHHHLMMDMMEYMEHIMDIRYQIWHMMDIKSTNRFAAVLNIFHHIPWWNHPEITRF